MKIPNEIVPLAYEISKKVYNKELTFTDARDMLALDNKMNPGSAGDYIHNLRYMLEGKEFARTLNAFSMEYYLEHIYLDYGKAGLSNALKALQGHIEYYEKIRKPTVRLVAMRDLYQKYLSSNSAENPDELEQNEIAILIEKDAPSKSALLEELLNIKETDPELIDIKGKAYKRDNITIAKIKVLHDFQCQICSTSIIKRDGTKYIEAAHIKPKHLKGCETLDNIILLCPNHHKEFDLGNSEVENHTKTSVNIILNGTKHHIKFEPAVDSLPL